MGAIPDNEWSKEVDSWIDISNKKVEKRRQILDQGKADQSTYTGLAGWLEYLGLSKFLRNDTIAGVRQAFSKSAECIETSFRMAYDESHPKYLGEKADLVWVSITLAIDGVQSQHIVYTYVTTSFTLSGMISSKQKGGGHGLEGNDSDGAENRVHYRMAIRGLLNH